MLQYKVMTTAKAKRIKAIGTNREKRAVCLPYSLTTHSSSSSQVKLRCFRHPLQSDACQPCGMAGGCAAVAAVDPILLDPGPSQRADIDDKQFQFSAAATDMRNNGRFYRPRA